MTENIFLITVFGLMIIMAISLTSYSLNCSIKKDKIVHNAGQILNEHHIYPDYVYKLTNKTTGNILMFRPVSLDVHDYLNDEGHTENTSKIVEMDAYITNFNDGTLALHRLTVNCVIELFNDPNMEVEDKGKCKYRV